MKIILVLLLKTIYCFFNRGHSYLGYILKSYLKHNDINTLFLLDNMYPRIEKDSVWADYVKRREDFQWSKKLHYIDIEQCPLYYNRNIFDYYCKDGCITSAIENFTLKSTDEIKKGIFNSDSQKFLIHFIQDISQPYHLYGWYRGGNDYKIKLVINGAIKHTNLHTLYDSILIDFYIHYDSFNLNTKIRNIEFPDSLYIIAAENARLACKMFPKNNVVNFSEYYKKEVIEMLIKNYLELSISVLNYIEKHKHVFY